MAARPECSTVTQELVDSFWFSASEVEFMFDNISEQHRRLSGYRSAILQTIRKWYDGYIVGSSPGKYNP
ncbi:hypothetical protein IWW38_001686, partial [Coemansia aciculifera]